MNRARLVRLLCCTALAGASAACQLSVTRFGAPLPDASRLAGIEPGRTTTAEVLALLGPPEEFRAPGFADGAREWDVPTERVHVEHDLVARRHWTWIDERRIDREFSFLPRVARLFSWDSQEHRAGRVVVMFDEAGIVTAVGVEPGP